MVDPGTAMLIAAAVSAGANALGKRSANKKEKKNKKAQQKNEKYRTKETNRETKAGLLQDALKRSADLESQRLAGTEKLSKSKTNAAQNTADLVREAFKI